MRKKLRLFRLNLERNGYMALSRKSTINTGHLNFLPHERDIAAENRPNQTRRTHTKIFLT